jgi:hypothetical protein
MGQIWFTLILFGVIMAITALVLGMLYVKQQRQPLPDPNTAACPNCLGLYPQEQAGQACPDCLKTLGTTIDLTTLGVFLTRNTLESLQADQMVKEQRAARASGRQAAAARLERGKARQMVLYKMKWEKQKQKGM